MKLTIQKTNEAYDLALKTEIKDILELLSQLENDWEDEFETELDVNYEANEESEEISEMKELEIDEDEDEFLIRIAAPGFEKEDFVISVSEDKVLSVNAEIEEESIESSGDSIRKAGIYHSFQLPEDTDIDEIEAIYTNDILNISIGKNATDEVLEDEM